MSMTPDPLAGVMIQSREIYDAIVRLTGRVDVLIAQHDEHKNKIQDHESRIRNLEVSRWPLSSLTIIIALAALGFAVMNYLTN